MLNNPLIFSSYFFIDLIFTFSFAFHTFPYSKSACFQKFRHPMPHPGIFTFFLSAAPSSLVLRTCLSHSLHILLNSSWSPHTCIAAVPSAIPRIELPPRPCTEPLHGRGPVPKYGLVFCHSPPPYWAADDAQPDAHWPIDELPLRAI